MRTISRFVVLFLSLAVLPGAHCQEVRSAGRKLVLFGGGAFPGGALDRFVQWSGGAGARILVLTWASGVPQEAGKDIRDALLAHGATSVEFAMSPDGNTGWAAAFRAQLSMATGVFISGGDQNVFMAAVDKGNLSDAFLRAYESGTVFAGTSAGTAVMSPLMITGDGNFDVIDGSTVVVRSGLGLLPGTITDQHFIVRQRENRLMGLILKHPDLLGVGVDEATAFSVREGRSGEVFGTTGAVVIVAGRHGSESLSLEILRPGQRYDLKDRRRL